MGSWRTGIRRADGAELLGDAAPPDKAPHAAFQRITMENAARQQVTPPVRFAAPGRPLLVALLAATRPRQWIKNLLVFAAPMAAGVLSRPADLGRAGAAAVIFVVASAGVYLINDVMDAPADRFHPVKRGRPVASGELPAKVAATAGIAALTLALTASAVLAGVSLVIVTAAYITISVCYSLWLKRQAVIELACVSSGFVLRAVAGGVAVRVVVSPWFILVTSAAALLVVAGKRTAEQGTLSAAASHRPVLDLYPAAFLLAVRIIAGSVAIISYALWAFGRSAHIGARYADEVVFQLSILPFVMGLLLVELTVEDGGGTAPEEMALSNRTLQVLGLVCVTLIAVGVYT
jgi:decaprenyl-phosphate phosphoribosyltransferase